MMPRDVGWRFQMKWFRSNIRHGARLAMFAMLVQFALTFGHSHWFAQAAPLASSGSARARVRELTVARWPASIRCPHIELPITPVPIQPMFTRRG